MVSRNSRSNGRELLTFEVLDFGIRLFPFIADRFDGQRPGPLALLDSRDVTVREDDATSAVIGRLGFIHEWQGLLVDEVGNIEVGQGTVEEVGLFADGVDPETLIMHGRVHRAAHFFGYGCGEVGETPAIGGVDPGQKPLAKAA